MALWLVAPFGASSWRNGLTTPVHGNSGSATLALVTSRRSLLPSSSRGAAQAHVYAAFSTRGNRISVRVSATPPRPAQDKRNSAGDNVDAFAILADAKIANMKLSTRSSIFEPWLPALTSCQRTSMPPRANPGELSDKQSGTATPGGLTSACGDRHIQQELTETAHA
jgi:hypothetical protein